MVSLARFYIQCESDLTKAQRHQTTLGLLRPFLNPSLGKFSSDFTQKAKNEIFAKRLKRWPMVVAQLSCSRPKGAKFESGHNI